MTPHTHLTAARALIAAPERWTKGVSGRTADGGPSLAIDMSDATCFCSIGALWRVSHSHWKAERILHDTVYTTTPFGNIASFNDDPATTHADVLRVFDVAIARAAKE